MRRRGTDALSLGREMVVEGKKGVGEIRVVDAFA
jgi:hypothetical protein